MARRLLGLFRRLTPVLTLVTLLASAIAPMLAGSRVVAAGGPAIDWIRQFGTSGYDKVGGVAADSTGIYVVGYTGLPFLRKYDSDGNVVWIRDNGGCVAVDPSGIYVAGGPSVWKYDTDGNEKWVRQIEDESYDYGACAISADSNRIYVGGVISYSSGSMDIAGHFVRMYDADGNVLWTRYPSLGVDGLQLGMSADSTSVYLAGTAHSGIHGVYAFVCKYDSDGNLVWYHRIDSGAEDYAWAVSADSTGAYVAGHTYDQMPSPSSNFVRKYDTNGNEIWIRQIVSSAGVAAYAISAYGGDIYVGGSVSGALSGQTNLGSDDAFACRYDANGNQLWVKQFGSGDADIAYAVSATANGIFVGGDTYGTLPGCSSHGSWDAFLLRMPINDYPTQPVNISPANEVSDVSLTPTLQSSDFSDPDSDIHVASRWQVRSSTGNYSSPVWDSGASLSLTNIEVPSGKLSPSTTYYWRVGHQDSRGYWSAYSNETSFTTIDTPTVPPTVVTNDATSVGTTMATVNGSLILLGTADNVTVSFEWGLDTSYGNNTNPQVLGSPSAFSFAISGLASDTTFHFRARAVGDGTVYGDDMTFTTGTLPPAVTTSDATAIGATSVTLNGNLSEMGTASPVQVSFEYGESTSYGSITPHQAMAAEGTFSANLTGLKCGTVYHFRAKAVGVGTVYGEDRTSTTAACPMTPPTVVTHDASNITTTSATLNGDLTSMGTAAGVTVSFECGATPGGSYNMTAEMGRDSIGTFSVVMAGFTPGTTYYYRVSADGDGDTVYGVEKSFTTAQNNPLIENVNPGSGKRKQHLTVTIGGANLDGATNVSFGPGITVEDFDVVSSTQVTVEIRIDAKAAKGTRDVSITTGWGTATKNGAFSVEGGGGGVCSGGALATRAGPSEMTTVLIALGILLGVGHWLLRRGTRNSVRA